MHWAIETLALRSAQSQRKNPGFGSEEGWDEVSQIKSVQYLGIKP